MANENETVGQLVWEYREVIRSIADNEKALAEIGEALAALGLSLRSQRRTIYMTDKTIVTHDKHIPRASVEMATLDEHLKALQDAVARKKDMDAKLRALGLEEIVRNV